MGDRVETRLSGDLCVRGSDTPIDYVARRAVSLSRLTFSCDPILSSHLSIL